jgi:excisionase family DNA binding protein
MYRSLGEAAKATGVSKSTILRAIKAHRISAERTDTGDWTIDPAELHRTYPVARAAEQAPAHDATAVLEAQIAGLRETADLLRRQLDDVREDRDHWRTAAQATQRLLEAPAQAAQPTHRWWRWRRLG